MRWLLALGLALVGCARAAEPSDAAVQSCLLSRSTSPRVALRALPTGEILSEDNYRSGYDAPYYFRVHGQDIGYAEKDDDHALLFAGDLYPLASARLLPGTRARPLSFNPHLADWSTVAEGRGRYLCVSFNLDGLGRSGNFQAVRGGYLLSTGAARSARRLYFALLDTRAARP